MKGRGEDFRTIWLKPGDKSVVQIIDQRKLPHEYVVADLRTWRDGAAAISDMLVRGAPLIGATAAWSVYLAALEYANQPDQPALMQQAIASLANTRPTAVNLRWALDRVAVRIDTVGPDHDVVVTLRAEAENICDEDI